MADSNDSKNGTVEEKFADDPQTFTFEHFFSDLRDLMVKPKEIAPRLADAPYNPIFLASFFMTGISMGMRKIIASNGLLDLVAGTGKVAKTQSIVELGQRDASLITAMFIPFIIIIAWYIASFAINWISEKFGGFNGSYGDIKSVLGYMGVLLMFFDFIMLIMFVVGHILGVGFIGVIVNLLYWIFGIWMLYIGTMCTESIYGMPMSYSGIVFIGVILSMLLFYYIVINLVCEQFILSEMMKGKYEIRR